MELTHHSTNRTRSRSGTARTPVRPTLRALLVSALAGGFIACTVPAPSFIGDPAAELHRAGVAALERGETARARQLLERAWTTAREADDWKTEAQCLSALAVLAERRGDVASAERLYGEMLDTSRKLGDRETMLASSLAVSRLALDRGDLVTSASHLASAQSDAIALGTLTARGLVMVIDARRLLADRFLDEAESKAREAVRLFDMQGPSLERTTAHIRARLVLGEILRDRNDMVNAIGEFRSAALLAEGIGDSSLLATARESIAACLIAGNRSEDAVYFLELAVHARMLGEDADGASRDLEQLLAISRTDGSPEARERTARYEQQLRDLSAPPIPASQSGTEHSP